MSPLYCLIFLSLGIAPLALGSSSLERAARKHAPPYLRPKQSIYPPENLYSKDREELGKMLFFDPRISGSNWISCATCHNPALAWGDGLAKGLGHGMKELGRRTPTILNLAWGATMFWDGRAETLEEQALGPIAAAGEMNLPLKDMLVKLESIAGYKAYFQSAYPGEGISEKTVAKAIATFERAAAVSAKAPFDKWVEGDTHAISDAAKRGFVVFNEKGNCANCHSGWRFTDEGFYDIGIAGADVGRGKLFPDIEVNQFAFKTPGLRNILQRSPYFHDGSAKTLSDVIDLYNKGGVEQRPSLSSSIKPLALSAQEKADLIDFLKSLTSHDKPVILPVLPN